MEIQLLFKKWDLFWLCLKWTDLNTDCTHNQRTTRDEDCSYICTLLLPILKKFGLLIDTGLVRPSLIPVVKVGWIFIQQCLIWVRIFTLDQYECTMSLTKQYISTRSVEFCRSWPEPHQWIPAQEDQEEPFLGCAVDCLHHLSKAGGWSAQIQCKLLVNNKYTLLITYPLIKHQQMRYILLRTDQYKWYSWSTVGSLSDRWYMGPKNRLDCRPILRPSNSSLYRLSRKRLDACQWSWGPE